MLEDSEGVPAVLSLSYSRRSTYKPLHGEEGDGSCSIAERRRPPRWGARDFAAHDPSPVQRARGRAPSYEAAFPEGGRGTSKAYLNDDSETDLSASTSPAPLADEVSAWSRMEGDKGDAFLVNWCIDDDTNDERAVSARVAPLVEDEEEEEDDVLGPVCQWRSCSCAARSSRRVVGKKQPNRPLCAWHRSLKRHLDDGAQAAGRASDALRFVPRAKAAREAAEAVKASKKSNYGDQDAAEAAAIAARRPYLSNCRTGSSARRWASSVGARRRSPRSANPVGRTRTRVERAGQGGMMQGRCRPPAGTSRRRSIA